MSLFCFLYVLFVLVIVGVFSVEHWRLLMSLRRNEKAGSQIKPYSGASSIELICIADRKIKNFWVVELHIWGALFTFVEQRDNVTNDYGRTIYGAMPAIGRKW